MNMHFTGKLLTSSWRHAWRGWRCLLPTLLFAPLLASMPAHAVPGSVLPAHLDTSFASTGRMIRPYAPGHTYESAHAIALQSDGRLLVATACLQPASNIPNLCVYRLETDGTPDASFAGGSTVVTPTNIDWYSSAQFQARVAIQSSGRIVLATACRTSFEVVRMCVTRLNVNGSIDTSFGTNGQVTLLIGNEDVLAGLVIDAVDRIVVAGSCRFTATRNDFCLARLTASAGALDSLFGNGGTVTATFAPGQAVNETANALAISPAGHLILVGRCERPAATADMCIARFGVNGSVLGTFGTGGVAYVGMPLANDEDAYVVALQPDGKIIAGGYCPEDLICLVRLLANGSLDRTFDTNNAASGMSWPVFPNATDMHLRAMVLQKDGRILIGANCKPPGAQQTTFCVARLWPEGYADTSFGSGGYAMIDVTHSRRVRAMELQSDGRIVVAGDCSLTLTATTQQSCVLRLQGGPNTFSACSFDVDGDGLIKPETDGLMMLRAMLGFSESRLLEGITIPTHARRTTYAEIRDFLGSQCGLSVRLN